MTHAMTAVLAVDGGNSKTDLVLVGRDGRLLASVSGPTSSHQVVGVEMGMARLDQLIERAARDAGLDRQVGPVADIGVYGVAGADLASDVRLLRAAVAARGHATRHVVVNDGFAALRAGTKRGWGVAVICGAGVNCVGVAPDGRTARLAALGDISGDWGGGSTIGMAALGAAVRGRDGRGRRTELERLVPGAFGLRRPIDVTHALYAGRLDAHRLLELSPVVFSAVGAGDLVARELLDRLADELATMTISMLRRLGLMRTDADIILAGGLFGAIDRPFYARIDGRTLAAAPNARMQRLVAPPVLGAAIIGLDALGLSAAVVGRLAAQFEQPVARPIRQL